MKARSEEAIRILSNQDFKLIESSDQKDVDWIVFHENGERSFAIRL